MHRQIGAQKKDSIVRRLEAYQGKTEKEYDITNLQKKGLAQSIFKIFLNVQCEPVLYARPMLGPFQIHGSGIRFAFILAPRDQN